MAGSSHPRHVPGQAQSRSPGGPTRKAAQALAVQELNRFKEADAQLGRHIEEVIAESEKRRTQAALSRVKVNYAGKGPGNGP